VEPTASRPWRCAVSRWVDIVCREVHIVRRRVLVCPCHPPTVHLAGKLPQTHVAYEVVLRNYMWCPQGWSCPTRPSRLKDGPTSQTPIIQVKDSLRWTALGKVFTAVNTFVHSGEHVLEGLVRESFARDFGLRAFTRRRACRPGYCSREVARGAPARSTHLRPWGRGVNAAPRPGPDCAGAPCGRRPCRRSRARPVVG